MMTNRGLLYTGVIAGAIVGITLFLNNKKGGQHQRYDTPKRHPILGDDDEPHELDDNRAEHSGDYNSDDGLYPKEDLMEDCPWMFDKEESLDGDHLRH